MSLTVNITEAEYQFSSLIQHTLEGEDVIITKEGIPVARLSPAKSLAQDKSTERQPESDISSSSDASRPSLTVKQLLASDLLGLWEERDLPDSPLYARQLRNQAQHRIRQD